MSADPRTAVVSAAIAESGILGCGCCANYTTPTCACGKELWELHYEACATCGETPPDYEDRADALARIVLNAIGSSALVADLRALCDDRGDFRLSEADAAEVRAILDRHAGAAS